jgi:HD-like signal output (HDOD) protein
MSEHFRGRLEVFGLADLLQWMELNRRSGRLIITRGHDRRTLDWKDGEIVYVSGALPRHRLGVHLLRSGALPAATLYELLARNMTTQENLTRLILEMGHDTLDGLSLRVEELARKLLFETFEWREANFDYDPTYRVTPILRIGLTLRGQALAFQGVKQLDDTHRLSRRERRETWEAADAWVLPFLNEAVEEHFWEALERLDTPLEPLTARGHATRFHEFARRLRERLIKNYLMRPVHEDTASLLLELLKKSPLDTSAVVPIAALDQYLTLDLLILANSLSVDRENSVGTVPEAIQRIGPRALTVLIDRLSSNDFPALAKNDPAARAVRRASLAAALAAGRFAERYGVSRERGYTLGLLHCIGYSDLFEVVREMNLPAGQFRGAVLETYRPAVGRARAEIWGLPRDFEAILSDDGTDPSASAALVRKARAAVPSCAVGSLPVDLGDDLESDEIATELNMLFDYLGLEPVAASKE